MIDPDESLTQAKQTQELASINKQHKRYSRCSWCCGICSAILIVLAALTPYGMNQLIQSQAAKTTTLTEANEKNWNGIPGYYDLGVYFQHYLYNCTNHEDVLFKNAKPEFMEFGPYIYQEYDVYDNITWTELQSNQDGQMHDAVRMNYNTHYKYVSSGDDFLDTKMYQANQAGIGVWWNQLNAPKWRVMITLIYSLVTDGMGTQVQQTAVFEQIVRTQFKTESKINSEFLVQNPIEDPAMVTALYTDPWYGLNNLNNYLQWMPLMEQAEPLDRLAFKSELRSYFGLSQAQVDEMQTNWNAYYDNTAAIINTLAPVGPNYENVNGISYWQWATGFFTKDQEPSVPSILDVTNTVTGYPEISYWKKNYFLPNITAANAEIFADTKLYADMSSSTANYEHLWNLTKYDGSDPDPNSFFNIQTLKQFVALGDAVPNIIKSPDLVYGKDFQLGDDWTTITQTLQLDDEKQTYMVWLWLDTAWDLTFERIQSGGSKQIGVIGQLGATAFQLAMTGMRLEFPLMTYSTQMEIEVAQMDCTQIYTESFSTSAETASLLCANATFDFSDPFLSSFANLNMVMYGSELNATYKNQLMEISNFTESEFSSYVNQFEESTLYTDVLQTVKSHYSSECDSTLIQQCAVSNLTYNQWLSGSILKNPLPSQVVRDTSYVRNYAGYTQLVYPIELFYYSEKSGKPVPPDVTIDTTYQSFNMSGLFNPIIFADVFLDFNNEGWANSWNTAGFLDYLKYITINFGLNGQYYFASPRDYIEGYNDPLLETLASMPIYEGGDQCTSPFLSLDAPPTHPKDNPMAFFTGVQDHSQTREVALWLNQTNLTVFAYDYESISNIVAAPYSPWEEPVPLTGTDGMQFAPGLTEQETLTVFVNDLSRSGTLDYARTDSEMLPWLNVLIFKISDSLMYNMTKNPANENYQVYVDGTSNMTTTLKAPAFISKGHFYQISPEVADAVPIIVDINGNKIIPNQDNDDTFMGAEQITGVNCLAKERLQNNFQIFDDTLFQIEGNTGYGMFVPLVLVHRESQFNEEQTKTLFKPLLIGLKAKWAFFGLLLGMGLICAALTVMYIFKRKKARLQILRFSVLDGEVVHDDSTTPLVQE